MPIVIGLNPVKTKKRTSKPKGKKAMAKRGRPKSKKTTPSIRYRVKEKVKYRYRNSRPKKAPYRSRRKDSPELDLKKIIGGSFFVAIGMITSKAAVNKLTEGGSEQIRWTWPNIATAAASSTIAAFLFGAVLKLKKPTVGYIAGGGIALAMYKAFTCKLAPRWTWSESWFGADEDIEINPEFLGAATPDTAEFEVVEESPMLGAAGGQLVQYDPSMGDAGGQVVPYDRSMGQVDELQEVGRRQAAYPGSY